MNKIELSNISKAYEKQKPVIVDMNLEIKEGSFTVLLGPSGCGKSTTLRMIAGLEKETSGELSIDGKSMKQIEPGDRDIAMVFQNYALYPTMTVRGNIEFGLTNHKIPKEERVKRIEDIGAIVGLTEFMNRKPHSLSGGQRQRVALARAMVKHPSVFLMDEPLSNLDAKLRSQLRTELIELYHRLQTTFVYVTHDQIEAMSMGTEIVLMNQGKIMQQGTPIEIYNNPKNVFTAQFIGTPPMNVIERQMWEELEQLFPSREIAFIGFRPEHALLEEDVTNYDKRHDMSLHTDQENIVEKGQEEIQIKGNVVTHEMLGSEVLYKLDTDYGRVNVKIFDLEKLFEGKVIIRVPKAKLYYFDAKKERIYE